MRSLAMFRVKICGLTRPADATVAITAGGDAIGLKFYPRSPRFVTSERAREIAAVVPAGVVKVGVFVTAGAAEICRLVREVPLDAVQLHGDEPPELVCELRA